MTSPDVPAHIEAGAKALYKSLPITRKDLVTRWEAEAATNVSHGPGVPDRWLACAVWQAAARERLKDETALNELGAALNRAQGPREWDAAIARFLGVEDTKEDA